MKKTMILTAAAILLTMSISSCSKCQICTKDSEPEARICKGDYRSETEYGFAIDTKEALGYSCKASF